MNRELLSIEELNLKPGEYAVCLARRNPFSEWYPMVIKRVRNGYVCPVMEQYVTDILGDSAYQGTYNYSKGGSERWLNIMWGLAYLESIVGR